MAGSAKFASQEMKDLCASKAGQEGPKGQYDDMVGAGSIPEELPCEAWGIWNASGELCCAASADNMNGWYFHIDAADLPFYSNLTYTAQDPQGNEITVTEGELMANFIAGANNFFYVNGERFTLAGDRNGPDDVIAFPVPCTGPTGRGAVATFDTAGTGVSIHIYTTAPAVRTAERLGLDSVDPSFTYPAVDARGTLADKISKHTASGVHPFWVTGNGA
eukprot:Protomagalhaensia_wolfi_Nauph_80__5758@NODE_701_length_2092_cov_17_986849_g524_i0_p2_GENE_NODE_701_length_2092_cov_17_986849_g524_i0NODE_701_length_2092_cov_17_986849_g524_i0_p2_ORF_typecomplete_len219_score44_65DUF5011/PF16403_5/0_53DUF5011/PF16403_5/3_5e03_NODE_701_length_2092_cov_17_986849_g524_i07663